MNCQWVGLDLIVEPGSTVGNVAYRVILSEGGNITCPGMNSQLPGLSMSMSRDGAVDPCVSTPRIQGAAIDNWITNPVGQKSFSVNGSANCVNGATTTTENANLTFTLVPCNGGPCLQQ